jgi:glycosyltransferase involved in cell wall biosynthesis
MNKKPLVSVVIPTFNGYRYLKEALDSVLRQSYENFEIIVVDDGSGYDVRNFLCSHADRIKLIQQKNGGPAKARNTGIGLSNGSYIAFLDDDDIWLPDNLQEKVEILEAHRKYGMVYSYPELIDQDGNRIDNVGPSSHPEGHAFDAFLKRNRITSPSAVLVRRRVLDKIGFFDERPEKFTCEDYDLWLRITDRFPIKFCHSGNVCYRIHQNNISKKLDTNFRAHWTVFMDALNRSGSIACLKEKELAAIIKVHIAEKCRTFAFNYYYNEKYSSAKILFAKAIKYGGPDLQLYVRYLACFLSQEYLYSLRKLKRKLESIHFILSSKL